MPYAYKKQDRVIDFVMFLPVILLILFFAYRNGYIWIHQTDYTKIYELLNYVKENNSKIKT